MSARQSWAEPTQLQVRAAGLHDHDRIARFLAAMDRDGLYERHFAHGEAPNQALLRRMEALDQGERVAVLAVGYDGEVLGHAEYVAERGAAEFALMVLPLFRHHGIGRRLLNALLEIAAAAGQREMHGIIQATNTRALQLVRNSGFRLVPGIDRTTVIASRQLSPSQPPPFIRHDPDRTSLHRRPGPGAPLRAGGG